MNISREEFDKTASLAKLSFAEGEKEEFLKGFSEIVSFADAISEEVASAENADAFAGGFCDLRDDIVTAPISPADALKNGQSAGSYFAVENVIGEAT